MIPKITIDEAHVFAQGLIAAGWHNADPDCVSSLHRQLETALAAYHAELLNENLTLEAERQKRRIGELYTAMHEHGSGFSAWRDAEVESLKWTVEERNAVIGGLMFDAAKVEVAATAREIGSQIPSDATRQNMELVIARLEQIADNSSTNYREDAEQALACARAVLTQLAAVLLPAGAAGQDGGA
ncbi:MAG: hypothetical protein ABIT83_20210 [Massilia sp.]